MDEKNTMDTKLILGDSDFVTLKVINVEMGDITVEYNTVNHNVPSEGDYIGLWLSNDGVIEGLAKTASPVNSSSTSGKFVLVDCPMQDKKYVLGYCQCGNPTTDSLSTQNVSASAYIDNTKTASGELDYSAIENAQLKLNLSGDSSLLRIYYTILQNMSNDKHWIGIWQKSQSINRDKPVKFLSVSKSDSSRSGMISLLDTNLIKGKSYVLGYFAEGYNDDITKLIKKHAMGIVEFDV